MADDDGLSHDWSGRVFLNPPYKHPLCQTFVGKLCDSFVTGSVAEAILLTNDQTDTHWWQHAVSVASAICCLSGRISFYNEDGAAACPTNGQTFFYFGQDQARFSNCFADKGVILSRV